MSSLPDPYSQSADADSPKTDPAEGDAGYDPERAAASLGGTSPKEDAPASEPQRPRGARRKKAVKSSFVALKHSLALVLLFACGIMFAVLISIGRPIAAPDWLRSDVNAQIENSLSGYDASLGRMELVLRDDLNVEVRAGDVQFTDDEGQILADLADVSVVLDRTALLQRRTEPKSISISGLQIGLRRTADGQFNLALGEAADLGPGRDLGQVLASLDQAFEDPILAGISSIEGEALSLRYEDLKTGRAYLADGGRFSFEQSDIDASLRADIAILSGASTAASMALRVELPKDEPGAAIGITMTDMPARDLAGQTAILSWLSAVDAPLSGSLRFSLADDGGLGPLFGTLDFGSGALRPTQVTRPIAFDAARSYFSYDPVRASLSFDDLFVVSGQTRAQATGTAYLDGPIGAAPSAVLGQLQFSELTVDEGLFSAEAKQFETANVDFRLRLAPFGVDIGNAVLQPVTTEGVTPSVRLSGRVDARAEGWDVGLQAGLDAMSSRQVMSFWPENLRPGVRRWFANNLLGGEVFNTTAAIRYAPGTPVDLRISSEFRDATLRFLPRMPAIQSGSGWATYEDARISVSVADGFVAAPQGGQVQVGGSTFLIPKADMKEAPAEVYLTTFSSATAALSILDQPPLQAMQKSNLPADTFEGLAELDGVIKFPLKEKLVPQDVTFEVAGDLRDVSSSSLLENRVLSAEALSLKADNAGVAVEGAATLDGVPFEAVWAQPLGPQTADAGSRLDATLAITQAALDAFDVGLPPGSVSGSAPASLKVDIARNEAPRFKLTSNLDGLALNLSDLNWSKAAGSEGQLRVVGTAGKSPKIEDIFIDAAGLRAEGEVTLGANGALDAAQFDTVAVGNWLNGPVTLRGRGPGLAPEVIVRGGEIDLRKTTFGDSGGSGQGGPLRLELDRLIITEGLALTNVRGDFSTEGAFSGAFTALVNGTAPIQGSLAPVGNGTAIRVISQDAGRVLGAAEMLEQGKGGSLELILRPVDGEGSYDGTLQVEDIRVQDAPALAGLLSAISVVGLLDQMASGGILFTDIDAEFRIGPERLTLLSSSATGPALGVSMDGIYAVGSGALDMQGVISPIYALNGIGQIFTRRGEGLIGFNFTVKGDTSSPRVGVNPLSLLTPGMFREIFRRPPPTVQ